MRKYTILAAFIASIITVSSCKYMSKEPSNEVNAANNEKLSTELKKAYPSLNQAYIGAAVIDFHDITVNLGDKELYNMSEAQQQEAAKNIAQIVYNIYDANNYLDKGTLILTESETEMPNASMPSKTYDLHLAEIVKEHEK